MPGRKRDRKWAGTTTGAILRNVYRGPCDEHLRLYAPNEVLLGDVVAKIEIDRVEILTATTDEGTFVALLNARLRSALDDMVCNLHAQTFPVHDEPYDA